MRPNKTRMIAATLLACAGMVTIAGPSAQQAAGDSLKGNLSVFEFGQFNLGPQGKNLTRSYEALHPGVKISIVPFPPGDPVAWEESVLAAGTAPDIVSPSYTMQIFSDIPKNYWLNLTPYLNQPNHYIAGNKRWLDSMQPSIAKQDAFEGSTYYVIPWNAYDATFFYNKDIFAKAGITHTPVTWADLMADSAKIKKAGYVPDLFYLGDTYPIAENGVVLSIFEAQTMSKTFARLDTNHDGQIDIKELVVGIRSHAYSALNADYQEAWKLFKQWSQYWQPNAAGNKGMVIAAPAVSNQLFYQGKAAMVYGATVLDQFIPQAKVNFHWGVFKFPQITSASSSFATPGTKGVGAWGTWNATGMGIPVTTERNGHLALALDFLQYLSSPRIAKPLSAELGTFPAYKGFTPSDPTTSVIYDLTTHPAIEGAAEATLGPEWLKERIAVQQEYILGELSLGQAMSDMQKYTDQAAAQISKVYHF